VVGQKQLHRAHVEIRQPPAGKARMGLGQLLVVAVLGEGRPVVAAREHRPVGCWSAACIPAPRMKRTIPRICSFSMCTIWATTCSASRKPAKVALNPMICPRLQEALSSAARRSKAIAAASRSYWRAPGGPYPRWVH
jgi:hypothetical protein